MSSDILKNDIKPDDELSLQIGERDGIRDKLKKMCRQNHLAAISAIVILIIILMATVSAFTLISALLMIVLERINMIGLLKTLGACNSSIRRIFIYLTQKLIFKALVIGNAVSLGLALLQQHFHIVKLDAESYYIPYVPVEIDWLTIILLNIAIIIVSYLTLIIPSLVISSIKPSRSINFE